MTSRLYYTGYRRVPGAWKVTGWTRGFPAKEVRAQCHVLGSSPRLSADKKNRKGQLLLMATEAPTKLLNFYNYRIEGGKFLADNYWEEEEPYELVQIERLGNGDVYVEYIDPETGEVIRKCERTEERYENTRVYGKTID
jgi:hypothetical protein